MSPLNLTFKALADPTRREILRLLSAGDLTAGEIAERFNITKPSISHHLGVLKQAGLVTDERRGQNIVYSLNTTVFQDVLAWLMNFTEKDEKSQYRSEGNRKHSGGKEHGRENEHDG